MEREGAAAAAVAETGTAETTAAEMPVAGAGAAAGAEGSTERSTETRAEATPPKQDPAGAPRTAGARRELTITVLIALLGGVIAWAAAGRPWATATVGEVPNTLKVAASGNDLSAGVTALGLTALAGGLALVATRRLARRLVGVLLIAAGVGVAVSAFGERDASHASHVLADKATAKGFAAGAVSPHLASWWIVAAIGGVLVALAGVSALVRSATWPGMSSRYENAASKPAAARAADTGSSRDLWDAMDRGEDPTENLAEDSADRPAEASAPLSPTPGAEH